MDTTLRTTVGNLGFETVEFGAPVLAADTIRAETEVKALRPTRSRAGEGILPSNVRGSIGRGPSCAVQFAPH